MQKKQIESIITHKINDWLDSLPKELAAKVEPNVIVTGGCIVSMLLNEKINDFDVYIKDKDVLIELCNHYMINILKYSDICISLKEGENSDVEEDKFIPPVYCLDKDEQITTQRTGILSAVIANLSTTRVLLIPNKYGFDKIDLLKLHKENEVPNYFPQFVSFNSINLTGDIQLISRFFGDAAEIHKNFDFVHCTNYFTFEDGLVTNKEALMALLNKRLVYIGSKYPLTSIIRIRKFITRGFKINAGQQVKIMLDLNRLNLFDPIVFVDQLAGVDLLTFSSLIQNLIKEQVFKLKDDIEMLTKIKAALDHFFEDFIPNLNFDEDDE